METDSWHRSCRAVHYKIAGHVPCAHDGLDALEPAVQLACDLRDAGGIRVGGWMPTNTANKMHNNSD